MRVSGHALRLLAHALRFALWLAFAGIALAFSILYHLQLPIARDIARQFANRFISDEIRGELEIGQLDVLDADQVVARYVSLYDGEGRRIIAANRVELVPDVPALRRGMIRFKVGRILGGYVRLVDNGDNEPSLFTTFDSPRPSHGSKHSEPIHALVDMVQLRDMILYGQFVQLEGVRAQHVDADGRLEIGHTVEIQIARAVGEVIRPFDLVGQVENLTGSISTDKVRGIKLDARVRRDYEEARAHIEYRSPAPSLPQELDLEIYSSNISADTLKRLDFAFAKPLKGTLEGRVHLAGPPERLAIEAQVQSDAGNADISGLITSDEGISVHVSSDRIEIDKLVLDGPSAIVRGFAHIFVQNSETDPEVHLELAATRYKGVLVPRFELDGTLEDNGLRIERARATQGGQLILRGFVGFDGRSDVHLDARFGMVQRDPNLSRLTQNLEGMLTASLRIRTPRTHGPERLDITGKIELHDARYGSIHADRLSLNGSVTGDPDLPDVDVSVTGDNVSVLAYNLGSANFTLHGGPPSYTYVAKGEFESKGQKTFNFAANVQADREGFTIEAPNIEFSVGQDSWRGLIHQLRVENEHSATLNLLRLASRAQRLEATGQFQLKGEDSLRAQLQNFDLAAVRALLGPNFPLSHGYADASLMLSGDFDNPVLSLQGAVREARLPGYADPFDGLYAIEYSRSRLELDGELSMPDRGVLHMTAQGELDSNESDPRDALLDGLYNVSLTSSDFDLTLIPAAKGLIEAGRLDGNIEAQGGVDSITLTGTLNGKHVQARNWAPLELAAGLHYDHDELSSTVSAKDSHGTLLSADVNWQVDWPSLRRDPAGYLRHWMANDFRIQGQSADRPFSELPFPLPWEAPPALRAQTRFEFGRDHGQLSGSLEAVMRAEKPLADETCQLSMASELRSQWLLTPDRTSMSFEGKLDERTVASGHGAIEWPFDAYLRGEKVEQRPRADLSGSADFDMLQRVPALCQHGKGELHARWDLRSLFSSAPSVALSLRSTLIPEVRVRAGEIDQVVHACEADPLIVSLDASADGKSFSWQGDTRGCSGGPVTTQGTVPIRWQESRPLPEVDPSRELNGFIDMQAAQLSPILNHFPGVRGFSAIGRGRISARARQGKVDLRGQLSLSNGKLYVLSMAQEMHDVGVILGANGNWMKVDELKATAGSGKLEASGGIGFDGWWPRKVQQSLVLKDFPIQREGVELAWLTGNTGLVAEIREDASHTAIKLNSLTVRLPDTSSRNPISLEPHPDIVLTTDKPKPILAKPYSFEFVIEGRDKINAYRNDFEVNLATELAIAYRDPDLHVGGFLEFRRGTFEVFGKKFEVNRGSMRFDGSTELNPEINLVATHQPGTVGSTPIYVTVQGTLADPHVEFYSEQCPGEGAVVLLVSGRCPTETDTGDSDARGTQNAFAAGILGGIVTLGARSQLGSLIPRLAVESSARGTRTRLKAGFEAVPKFMRPLVQRIYVEGALSTGDTSGSSSATASSSRTTPDFLIQLYFPNNIIGAGKVAPVTRSWGLDVTWEP